MKINRYETVSGENPAKLDLEVNQRISDGWQLYGDPYTSGNTLYQALVLDADTVEKWGKETKAEIAGLLSKPGVKLTRLPRA